MPICVDPDLEAIEGFPLDGEAVGIVRRRIVIHADALDASDAQLHALVAHELAHHQGHHVLFGKVWKFLVTAAGLGLFLSMMFTAVITQDFRVLAVLVAFFLSYPAFVMLFSGWISRRLEIDADRRAARLLDTPEPIVSSLRSAPSRSSPSGLRERFWRLCYPWPSADARLAALDSEH